LLKLVFIRLHRSHGCPGEIGLLSSPPEAYLCIAQFNVPPPVTTMLTFLVYLVRRKRGYVWAPAVDLSDPYVAAALAPVTHS
jgi:hypothetical protein